MAKKDAVTKSKACHEILDLISEDNEERHELVQPLLLAWPRFYQKLVLEHDPRVRTQSHQVTINLLLLARKQSAPHLKSIMKWVLTFLTIILISYGLFQVHYNLRKIFGDFKNYQGIFLSY